MHLVGIVPVHVRAAAEYGLVSAEIGDARRLTQADASVDAVLLLGPLYHLVGRAERRPALVEARPVLRPGGVLLAAAIGRFMAALDWAQRGCLASEIAAKLLASGRSLGDSLLAVDAAFGSSVSNGRWLLGECCAATGSALVRIIRRPSVAPGVAGTHGARRPGRVEIASRMPTRAIRPPRLQRPERPGATRWWHRADSK